MISPESDIKCDIIIPVWNERLLTEKCIYTIRQNTPIPYRLIIIDNASDIETMQYLKALAQEPENSIKLIRNEENIGFPKAVNQGIAISKAPYLCILNNDTEVYKNWLEEMIKVGESNPTIGIINPSSNNLGQPKPLGGFSGKWIEMSSCIGFCMLIKRGLIEKIGSLDEIYSPGNFEDLDFSRRAVRAGYKCVMAKGSYVYHAQNTGFKKRKDRDEKFKRNLDIFNKKWGRVKRIAYVIKNTKEAGSEAVKEGIVSYLKNWDWVYVFLKKGIEKPALEEHGSLRIIEMDRFMFDIKVRWNILVRKKKFDKVIIPSSRRL